MAKNQVIKAGRTLYFEPNPLDNDILPTENYNIFVDLTSTRKSRSVITVNNGVTEVYNTGKGKSVVVRFIEGSNFYGENKSLTTRYTEEKKSNPGNNESETDDLESLGIENISIDFDTAYTPMINIRFIDIRGKAIMQEGSNSKYKMFFELPYPTFNLTVKGYYGDPVTYCLHLTKWNSNFNSDTGNFEIDAEFIGYTYALLTDLLVGLLRAVVRTEIGKPIFENIKKQYETSNEGIQILTIDEVIKKINGINNELNELGSNDPIIQETDKINKFLAEITKMRDEDIKNKFNSLKENNPNVFTNDDNFIVKLYEKGNDEEIIKALTDFKVSLKLRLTEISETLQLEVDNISNIDSKSDFQKNSLLSNNKIKEEIDKYIINNPKNGDKKFTYYDFTLCNETLNNEIDRLTIKSVELNKQSGDIIHQKTKEVLGFDSTIRNIIRVFAIHSEVLLKTIKEVTNNAEKSEERKATLDNIFTSIDNSNINKKDFKDKKYFAWPEYRELNNNEITETWLGSVLNGDEEKNKVDEVKFVEEIISILLKIAEEDVATQEIINTEIDTTSQISSFTPISTIDSSFFYPDSSTTNPYSDALYGTDSTGIPDEAMRLMLMRAFTLMGVSNVHYPSTLSQIIAKNEALMLYNTIKKNDTIEKGKTLIDEIQKIGDPLKFNDFINYWKIGSDKIKNPTKIKKPLLVSVTVGDSEKKTTTVSSTISSTGGGVSGVGTDISSQAQIETYETKTDYYKYNYIGNNELIDYKPSFEKITSININGQVLANNPIELIGLSIVLTAKINDMSIRKTPNLGGIVKRDIKKGTELGFVIGYEIQILDNNVNNRIKWFKVSGKLGTGYVRADMVTFKTKKISDNRYYIPISGKFDGIDFYNGDKLKSREKLKEEIGDDKKIIYITKPENIYIKDVTSYDDNSKIFKIIDITDYNGSSENQWLEIEKNKTTYESYLTNEGIIDEESLLKKGTYGSKPLDGLNPYSFKYNIQEFSITNSEKSPYVVGEFFNSVTNDNLPYLSSHMTTGFVTNVNKKLFYSANTSSFITNHNQTKLKPDDFINHGNNVLLINDIKKNISETVNNENSISYNDIYTPDINFGVKTKEQTVAYFSLFGSPFYYSQTNDHAKAFLFLHSLPLRSANTENTKQLFNKIKTNSQTDDNNSLKGFFNTNSGFINSNYLWCAHIGSLLYRYDEALENNNDIITYNRSFLPIGMDLTETYSKKLESSKIIKPRVDQYFYTLRGRDRWFNAIYNENNLILTTLYDDGEEGEEDIYKNLDTVLLNLPIGVRNEFKRIFNEFVKGDFLRVKSEFEILKTELSNGDNLINSAKDLLSTIEENFLSTTREYGKILVSNIENNKYLNSTVFKKNYLNITPYHEFNEEGKITFLKNEFINYHQFRLLLNPSGDANKLLNELYAKEVVIINNVPSSFKLNEISEILVKKTELELYIKSFFTEFKKYAKDIPNEEDKIKEDNIKQSIFNSIDDDFIKLNLYRTIGSISNKWISGSNEINFNGCSSSKNSHEKASISEGNKTTSASLIDTFKFLDRAFNDIGDEFFINPTVVRDLVVSNNNQSFFDVVNRILSDNNFNFIPLPSFTNFNNPDSLAKIFEPNPFVNSESISGPTFVCVYAGQTSSALSLGDDSNYPDDGITIHVKNGELINLPPDFSTEYEASNIGETSKTNNNTMGRSLLVPMFVVNYGLQNQSYFSNIKLDQREFTETAESLQIIDDLSKPANGNKPTYYGQNLFNIYQTRSYSTEIEMMGCAQIQPMMYFYLKDIPLFRGAYLIIKVSHKITPNHMTTNFKGVRVKRTKTPLVDKSTVFSKMFENIKIGTNNSRGTTTGSFPQIIGTIIENGGAYGAPESGKITMKKIPEINGVEIDNIVKNNDIKNRLISEATDALEVMLKDFVDFAKIKGFNKVGKNYIRITSAFRTVEQQVELVKNNERATDGSRHCWGIAVDFNFVAPIGSTLTLRTDGYIANMYDFNDLEKRKDVFNEVKNPSLKWFLDNSYKYGFILPHTMRDNAGKMKHEEFWHFEYHGTGAKELMMANPTTYGYTVKVDGTPNPIVKNPKTPSGEIAVYKNYDKTLFEAGDGDETTTTGCPKPSTKKPTVSTAETYKNQIEKLKTGNYVNTNGREQNESFNGFKTIPEFYSNGVLTKKGIAAITLALQEGLGSSPNRKNPGNIRKDSNNYKIYNTWGEGWRALHDRYFKDWVNGKVVAADSWKYPDCYKVDANKLFSNSNIGYNPNSDYNYKKLGDLPSLRQFVNIYAPWGDNNNPNNYIGGIAKTLKEYGYNINVDDPMKNWLT